MAPKALASKELLLFLSLLFFTLVRLSSANTATCPQDAPHLAVCADLLRSLLNVVIGTPPVTPCCSLIAGLVDLEAAVCLCTAIKPNILGINLDIRFSLSLLLNHCGRSVPSGFQCA